jgi:hypothetical protein
MRRLLLLAVALLGTMPLASKMLATASTSDAQSPAVGRPASELGSISMS